VAYERLLAGLRDVTNLLSGLPVPDNDCWLVGGAVRDAWLGLPIHDIDLVAPAPLDGLRQQLEQYCGSRAFTVNQRFASTRINAGTFEIDITALSGGSIESDLRRRDYCINAMAVPLRCVLSGNIELRDVICDPNALDDLASGSLRLVSTAALIDDPLRILRGFRLAAQLGMEPDHACREAWQLYASALGEVSGERQRDELLRWFGLPVLDTDLLQLCADCGVLWQLFSELQNSVDCTQNDYHHLDVWQHTLLALRELDALIFSLPPELAEYLAEIDTALGNRLEGGGSVLALTRLALLLHDVGKPATRRVETDGHISFIGHQQTGVELVEADFERLRFSGAERDFLQLMIREHLRLGFYSVHEPLPPKLVYRYIRSLGETTLPQLLHSLADCRAAGGQGSAESLRLHLAAAQQVADNYINGSSVARPPELLDGHDIMELLGIPAGPLIGRLKRAMLEATAEGVISTADEAREFVVRLLDHLPPEDPED
jgi:tRNA nucleotidyltransferase/poly(A) polymerase